MLSILFVKGRATLTTRHPPDPAHFLRTALESCVSSHGKTGGGEPKVPLKTWTKNTKDKEWEYTDNITHKYAMDKHHLDSSLLCTCYEPLNMLEPDFSLLQISAALYIA